MNVIISESSIVSVIIIIMSVVAVVYNIFEKKIKSSAKKSYDEEELYNFILDENENENFDSQDDFVQEVQDVQDVQDVQEVQEVQDVQSVQSVQDVQGVQEPVLEVSINKINKFKKQIKENPSCLVVFSELMRPKYKDF